MAAGNVRFRSQYYNTTGDSVLWTLDILDTEPTNGQIINFESTEPVLNFEGLTQDLKPGIYPTTLKFGMFVRDTPVNNNGRTFGPSASIITDLLASNEGRFRVKLYKGELLHFCGIILPDQCQYEDNYEPYLLSISAADGLYKLKDKSYYSLYGSLNYVTCSEVSDQNVVPDTTPLIDCLEGTEWVMIEHFSVTTRNDQDSPGTSTNTTYARRQQYSSSSPGTGWVDQGDGLWAKEIEYENEVVTSDTEVYHLTRDVVDSTHRIISNIFGDCLSAMGLDDEYTGVMYDVAAEWYETSMGDKNADPFTQARLHEKQLNDAGELYAVIEEICKLFFLRLYYANGRYHFEQISYRDIANFKRFTYGAGGTAIGTENVNLDYSLFTEGISVAEGGAYKILAPLKRVEVTVKLEGDNLLEGERWGAGRYGARYIGRVGRADGTQYMRIKTLNNCTTRFGLTEMAALDDAIQATSSAHYYKLFYQVRLHNIDTGNNYWLTGDADVDYQTTDDNGTWETSEYTFEKRIEVGTGGETFSESTLNLGKYVVFNFLSYDLPGGEGFLFDVYVSINYAVVFLSPLGVAYWLVQNPTAYVTTFNSYNGTMSFEDQDGGAINGQATKTYYAENSNDNSLDIKSQVLWSDTGRNHRSINIYNGTNWTNSLAWAVNGVAPGEPILQLCAREIMSLRVLPKRLYTGTIITADLTAENRIQRGSVFYLPLRADKNTDLDGFNGEFLEVGKTTPPTVDVIDQPLDESNDEPLDAPDNPGVGGQNPDDQPTAFETDEEISAASTLTQCAIVNTAGVVVAAGTEVQILNASTGEYDIVVLSQQVEAADTVMYFYSHTFDYSYPDGSPIIVDTSAPPPPNTIGRYYYANKTFTGTQFDIPNLDWAYLKGLPSNTFNRKVYLERNGVQMHMLATGDQPPTSPQYYRVDKVGGSFLFNGTSCLAFVEEFLVIDIDFKR